METIARTHHPEPQKKERLALDIILQDLQQSEDCCSGSECSSLATSPIERPHHSSLLSPLSREVYDDEYREEQRGRSRDRGFEEELSRESVEVVKRLFAHLDDVEIIEELVAEDADIQWLSHIDFAGGKSESTPKEMPLNRKPSRRGVVELQKVSSIRRLELDNIFDLGDHVAVFGSFDCAAHSEGQNCKGQFSMLANVDSETGQLVCLRWLDQAA